MGNCIYNKEINVNNNINSNKKLIFPNVLKNKINPNNIFIKFNIIDKKNNIILGIIKNSLNNSLNEQGIFIGELNKIYKLTFAIWHKCMDVVVMFFENNIHLQFFKQNNNFMYMLDFNNSKYEKIIEPEIIKSLSKFNISDSKDIDLLFNII